MFFHVFSCMYMCILMCMHLHLCVCAFSTAVGEGLSRLSLVFALLPPRCRGLRSAQRRVPAEEQGPGHPAEEREEGADVQLDTVSLGLQKGLEAQAEGLGEGVP